MKRKALAILVTLVAAFAGVSSAQDKPRTVTLELASTFPGSMPILGAAAHELADRVKRVTGGEVIINFHEPGEVVPGAQSVEAVSTGKIAAAWAGAGWFASHDSAFNFFSSVPFGPDIPEYLAWMYEGGGLELAREMFRAHDIYNIPCGLIPAEPAGWFRKEITTPADLKGLRMRIFGLGALVMKKFGVIVEQDPPGEIYAKLKSGALDAAEFSLPVMDQPLNFHEVAKYYYFPGWHQQSTLFDLDINLKVWNALPERDKTAIELACSDIMIHEVAKGEAMQGRVLAQLQERGVHLRRFPAPILVEFENAWNQVVAEESAKNPNFKRVYDSYAAFRKSYALWKFMGTLQ
ncbi:MAG TPA: TRAP transporter substrate-binding protein [Pseudolabrys sp.]|nr:TRAP transporter substrate-binding protein [Pseudolabrys sp.]